MKTGLPLFTVIIKKYSELRIISLLVGSQTAHYLLHSSYQAKFYFSENCNLHVNYIKKIIWGNLVILYFIQIFLQSNSWII